MVAGAGSGASVSLGRDPYSQLGHPRRIELSLAERREFAVAWVGRMDGASVSETRLGGHW